MFGLFARKADSGAQGGGRPVGPPAQNIVTSRPPATPLGRPARTFEHTFRFTAPNAQQVSVVVGKANAVNGDKWAQPIAMSKGPDGGWSVRATLSIQPHHYYFLVDGNPRCDEKARDGVVKDTGTKQRVNMLAARES